MVKKTDRRKRDIKTKLMAAICMLMVSCIMVISSTYAWFTLSTAPEVKGINTAVGANGNLEMALLPSKSADGTYYITAAEALAAIGNASTTLGTVAANTTWGNLVDLSDESYGLSKITLYPSTLTSTDLTNLPSYYLDTPVYGADGRFSGTNQVASALLYANGSFSKPGFGVRGVGTSSGMSAQEMEYRNTLAAANNAAGSALASAKTAVSSGASKLASMAVTKANGATTFTEADKTALVETYDVMLTAVGHMETALREYMIANYLTSGKLTQTTYSDWVETTGNTAALAELAALEGMNSSFAGYVTALNTLKTNLTNDKATLAAVVDLSWANLSGFVSKLADMDKMLLNEQSITDYWMVKGPDGSFTNLGELANLYLGGTPLTLKINASGSDDAGYFAQLADFVGNFNTPAAITGISYSGITVESLSVTVNVYKTIAEEAHLPAAKTAVEATGNGYNFGEGANSLSDFYGYIIDMAVRTNASDSSLLLQTDAVDRIYADSKQNPATMGGGSYISYTIPAGSKYTSNMLINLMTNIRIVFFDPTNSNSILGYARLDVTSAQTTESADGWTVKMLMKMCDASGNWKENAAIMGLVQNTATAISTMVYLDGVNLTNADIANEVLKGEMNLQFASSAALKPMEYGDLRKENSTTTETYSVSVNGRTLSDVTVNKDDSYTLDVSTVTVPDGQAIDTVTVTMGGQTVENAYSDGKVTIPSVDGDIEVTVAFKSAT